ncbi:MAG: AAA family ATPase [Candidatus Hodarchaeales archaeon]|jgi:vacuolar protein-sorting-associated protein 4
MSSDLFNIAKENARIATELDRAGRAREAMPYYVQAAENLQRLIRFTRDENVKKVYYERALEYLSRIDTIQKGKVKSPSTGDPDHKGKDDEKDSELSGAIAGAIIREKPNVKWDDVANLDQAKAALKEAVILPMARPDLFTGARRPWKGIMLFGPPGNGKTYLAKAVASEVDATFFSVSAANLISKWLGESEKLVQELYDQARKEAPSIIFFDEVDSLATARGQNESDAIRRVKTQLLQAVEGVGTGDELIVTIGATNLPWEIDPAMRRRFERRIMISLPDEEARSVMFKIHTKGVDLDKVDSEMMGKLSTGYTAADIALICREALMSPIRESETKLLEDKSFQPRNPSMDDFYKALETIKPSVAPQELDRYIEWSNQFGS